MDEEKETKKKVRTMDVVLVTIAIFLLLFVVAMIWLYYRTGAIPDTLCTCVFAACGGECGVMGWIKTTKDRLTERTFILEDREYEKEQIKAASKTAESEEL
nr:MAG TPA: transmembrane protein [Caudoviricetes sp.]